MEYTNHLTYSFSNINTYFASTLFILGNIMLTRLCHLLPYGGPVLLPIYFLTLIGAYRYGWRVGLITAIASPLINFLLFNMPGSAVLPAIITKSLLLAGAASFAAKKFGKPTVLILLAVVLFYQITGTLCEWAYTGNFALAVQDFKIAVPGMLLQIFGGWFFLNKIK